MHYNIWFGTVSLVHHKIRFDIPKKQDLQVGILTLLIYSYKVLLLIAFTSWGSIPYRIKAESRISITYTQKSVL